MKISRFFKIIALNLLAMVIVLFVICATVLSCLDGYTKHGQAVVVPNIAGKHVDVAATMLRDNNLDFEVVDYKYKKGEPKDNVLEVVPTVGSKVKEGRRVQLTLSSSNEPMQPLPNVVDNSSLREAEARLLATGFSLNPCVRISGEKDWIYFVLHGNDTLKNGSRIPVGTVLTLVVGDGEEEKVVDEEPIIEESWFE